MPYSIAVAPASDVMNLFSIFSSLFFWRRKGACDSIILSSTA
jgi:hypothetical protein